MAFESLKRLYVEELYSDVLCLGSFVITTMDRCPDFLTPIQRYQACVYYADALFSVKTARQAEVFYTKALSLRKAACSTTPSSHSHGRTKSSDDIRKGNTNASCFLNSPDVTSEVDVTYKLHICLVRQSKFKEAIGLLESIPVGQRTPKVHAALGSLFKRINASQAVVQSFKDLIATCPYALDAVSDLLRFGVGVQEIRSIVFHNPSNQFDLANDFHVQPWFDLWLNSCSAAFQRDYSTASSLLQEIDSKTVLANNPQILTNLALAQYGAGEYVKACASLQRVHSLDPLHVEGMDILASLLCQDKRLKELESLATQMMSNCPECPQSWIAMGYLCKAFKKLSRALYFAHKACGENRPNPYVDAMLLKGLILLDMKKHAEASLHFQEALQVNLFRYELYEGLVTCHLERNKLKEARAAAALCLQQTGSSALGLTLYATVLSKDSATLPEAQAMLERAIITAPYLLNAVYLLVQIYDKQKQFEKAVELLKRQTSLCVNSKLHGMLGEILGKSTLNMQAVDSYRFALTLDPTDEASLNGLNDLCQQSSGVGSCHSASLSSQSQRNVDASNCSSQQVVASSWMSSTSNAGGGGVVAGPVTPDVSSIAAVTNAGSSLSSTSTTMGSTSMMTTTAPTSTNLTHALSRSVRVAVGVSTTTAAAAAVTTTSTVTSSPSSPDFYQDAMDDSSSMDT